MRKAVFETARIPTPAHGEGASLRRRICPQIPLPVHANAAEHSAVRRGEGPLARDRQPENLQRPVSTWPDPVHHRLPEPRLLIKRFHQIDLIDHVHEMLRLDHAPEDATHPHVQLVAASVMREIGLAYVAMRATTIPQIQAPEHLHGQCVAAVVPGAGKAEVERRRRMRPRFALGTTFGEQAAFHLEHTVARERRHAGARQQDAQAEPAE